MQLFPRTMAVVVTAASTTALSFGTSTILVESSTSSSFNCNRSAQRTAFAVNNWKMTRLSTTSRLFSEKKGELVDDLYVVAASTAGNEVTSTSSSFATTYHAPVMWKECVEALTACPRAQARLELDPNDPTLTNVTPLFFVDGTLGGGGHSQALLEVLRPGDVVFGCDVDPDALAVASQRLSRYTSAPAALDAVATNTNDGSCSPWFVPVPSNFGDLNSKVLAELLKSKCSSHDSAQSRILCQIAESGLLVDGILLDLGVSSYQIDTAERGFAFMKDGPLDMRMNGVTGRVTAADLCNEMDAPELRRIFAVYGDEPRAKAIAQSIVERRPLRTTADLQEAVAAVTPQFVRKGRRMGRMATMARVFQSLRIVVNQEDVVLERALTKMAPDLLRSGGRLVVLSYHSMEDRATKRVMRDGTVSKREANHNNEQKDMYGNYIGAPKPFRALGKPQKATEAEVELNARARSATLRIAERLES